MGNKKKFLQLVSGNDTKTIADIKDRIKNRETLHKSQDIALNILIKLDVLGWTEKDLADVLDVSPEEITKIVSGKNDISTETYNKLENILPEVLM